MSSDSTSNEPPRPNSPRKKRPVVHFLLRGLAITLPPILTIWILVWIVGVLNSYVLEPTSGAVRLAIAQVTDKSQPRDRFQSPEAWMPGLELAGRNYVVTAELQETLTRERGPDGKLPAAAVERLGEEAFVPLGERAVPYADYREVARRVGPADVPATSRRLYMELAETRYFRSLLELTAVAVIVSLVLLYFIGRMVNARVGAWMVQKIETGVLARVPLVNQVYSSVKQVTDFVFTERNVEYNRVVAVEYPRRGLWSVGFVTGDSFLDLTAAAGEPLISVLMPTSPMPMTGFTISVPRDEVIDLDITVDQAFQFCLSCGVLVPAQQKVTPEAVRQALAQRLENQTPETNDDSGGRNSARSETSASADSGPAEAGTIS